MNDKKYPSASVDSFSFSDANTLDDGGPFFITLGDFSYTIETPSLPAALFEAIAMHVDEDRDTPVWMVVSSGESTAVESFFVPALLCGLNYITVDEFLEQALQEVLQDADETDEPD